MPLVPYVKLVCDFCEAESDMIQEKKLPDGRGRWIVHNVASVHNFTPSTRVLCPVCASAVAKEVVADAH